MIKTLSMKKYNLFYNFNIILLLITISCNSVSENTPILSLPPVLSGNMVLQQEQNVSFWGDSSPNALIKVSGSWGESSSTTADNAGKWILKIKTPSAGGPYSVSVIAEIGAFPKITKTIEMDNILIGEVWLSSGQSNMEWRLNQCKNCIDNQEEEIANVNNSLIRMFSVPQDLSGEVIKNKKWLVANPENAEGFSAAAYFFARELHKELNIPIGIVNTSWGGTRVEAWTSNNKLTKLETTKNRVPKIKNFESFENKLKKLNDSINKINEQKFGFKTYDVPKWTEDENLWEKFIQGWANLDLEDNEYKNIDFDDSKWKYWSSKYTDYSGGKDYKSKGRFESVFKESNTLLSDGVIWFRTKVKITDKNQDHFMEIKTGIDDADQTYFNGALIGNTFSWSRSRNYKIPKGILRNGENILAIRVTDLRGGGGFNSPVIIKNNSSSQTLSFDDFKFNHHAFITNSSSIIVHRLSHKELMDKNEKIKNEMAVGYLINDHNGYSVLFEKMLKPVMPYTIKGAIWYQGESNVSNYSEYQELFSGMIEDWRENWGYNYPFYYAQIAPFSYGNLEISQGLRDAQRKTLESTSKTGMAILMDIGEKEDIHPHNKQDVGKRLALLALDNDYNFDIVSSGPLYKSHKSYNNYIDVDFENKGSGLYSKGELKDFEIAGDNQVFYSASAKIIGNKVRVSSKRVKTPKHVRYGWKNWTIGSLFNKEGLPASSFNSVD